jgi:hypothetical protein
LIRDRLVIFTAGRFFLFRHPFLSLCYDEMDDTTLTQL